MNIAIFGATGGTGQELLKQALERGYKIKALVRSPQKLSAHDDLEIIQGDVRDFEKVRKTIEGCTVVFSCLGVKLGQKPIVAEGVEIIANAMKETGIKRLIVESAYGAGTPREGFYGKWLRYIIDSLIRDKEHMEEFLKKSELDFTIVRPSFLTNKGKSGKYKFGIDFAPHGFPKISRADVAEFMLNQIDDNKFLKKAVNISNA